MAWGRPRPRSGGVIPEPGQHRSWWLREALAAEPDGPSTPALDRDLRADVVVVGGSYTGLWAAYHLTELSAGLNVVLLERDIYGGRASGRNEGVVTGWWDELPGLVALFGERGGCGSLHGLGRSIRFIGSGAGATPWTPGTVPVLPHPEAGGGPNPRSGRRPVDPDRQARRLRTHANRVAKSLRWRLRAKVEERARWYELPEQVSH